jgi:hypothetical protein
MSALSTLHVILRSGDNPYLKDTMEVMGSVTIFRVEASRVPQYWVGRAATKASPGIKLFKYRCYFP